MNQLTAEFLGLVAAVLAILLAVALPSRRKTATVLAAELGRIACRVFYKNGKTGAPKRYKSTSTSTNNICM